MIHAQLRLSLILRLTILSLICLAMACSASEKKSNKARSGPLKITASTGMIGDVARSVGGKHADVLTLMGPGVDPHLYKATQGDLEKLTNADLILYNGLHLEGKLADVFVKMASRVKTVAVGDAMPEDQLREPPEFDGHYDPHVWFNVKLWMNTVPFVRDVLSEMDPPNASTYAANAEEYLARLTELDEYARTQLATVPREQRVLITAHDAFGYFGDAYDIDVMGLQGISTASEYGLHDLERVTDEIVKRKIKAVFVESSIPTKSIEALVRGVESKGHTVVIGGELFSDAMGAEGTAEGTYLGMVRHNVDTIVNALK